MSCSFLGKCFSATESWFISAKPMSCFLSDFSRAMPLRALESTLHHPPRPSTTLRDPPGPTVRLPAVGRKRQTFPPLLGASAAAWLWRDKSARPRGNEVEAGNLEL